MPSKTLLGVVVCFIAACQSPADSSGQHEETGISVPGAADAGAQESDSSSPGTATGSGSVPRLDLGTSPESHVVDTCEKVDVLYVIDNSGSMADEQETLIENFDQFIGDMQVALQNVDSYHIAVTTTDDYAAYEKLPFDPPVNKSVQLCQQLGGFVVESASGSCSPFGGGNNFITELDNLTQKFACVADVGVHGSPDEKPGAAMVRALELGAKADGCNAGFLRGDALLILVLLTDENDVSPTAPGDWYEQVVALKGGDPERVVVLALLWDETYEPCTQSYNGELTGTRLREFAEQFPNHAVGSLCDDSFAGFFAQTVPTIDEACDTFPAP